MLNEVNYNLISVSVSVCLSVSLFVCLYVCLSVSLSLSLSENMQFSIVFRGQDGCDGGKQVRKRGRQASLSLHY